MATIELTDACIQADLSDINMTPKEVVDRLDKYIVGQASNSSQNVYPSYEMQCVDSPDRALQLLALRYQ